MKKKPDPIFEELWRIKDSLAAEASYDLHRMCENTRCWAAEHPHAGPRLKDAAELRVWMARQKLESQILREEFPAFGANQERLAKNDGFSVPIR